MKKTLYMYGWLFCLNIASEWPNRLHDCHCFFVLFSFSRPVFRRFRLLRMPKRRSQAFKYICNWHDLSSVFITNLHWSTNCCARGSPAPLSSARKSCHTKMTFQRRKNRLNHDTSPAVIIARFLLRQSCTCKGTRSNVVTVTSAWSLLLAQSTNPGLRDN